MKVPVVLTTVRFDIDAAGRLKVSVDGQLHAGDQVLFATTSAPSSTRSLRTSAPLFA
jgi:hypothetical protein